jgi:hypothetical protein
MKRIAMVLLAGLLASPALAATGEMSVAAFLAKADGLRAMGFRALGSSDIKLLRDEGQAAGMAYRVRLQAEKAQGKPSSCPPKGVKVGARDVIDHLRTYPAPAKPSTTMRTALADYFIRKYPCPQ